MLSGRRDAPKSPPEDKHGWFFASTQKSCRRLRAQQALNPCHFGFSWDVPRSTRSHLKCLPVVCVCVCVCPFIIPWHSCYIRIDARTHKHKHNFSVPCSVITVAVRVCREEQEMIKRNADRRTDKTKTRSRLELQVPVPACCLYRERAEEGSLDGCCCCCAAAVSSYTAAWML